MNAGKGSKPRNCFSKKFKETFDTISWSSKQGTEIRPYVVKKGKKIYKYP